MMNIKLKKFKILEPKVRIKAGLKTISRESKIEIKAIRAFLVGYPAGISIIGNATFEEV